MKTAVIYEDGQVFQHFGKCRFIKIYTFDDGMMIDMTEYPFAGSGHDSVVDFMTSHGVDTVICGGIGAPAAKLLVSKGIELCAGVSGDADHAVIDFLTGRLNYLDASTCAEHGNGGGECDCC